MPKVCGNGLPHARQAYRHGAAAAMPAVTTLQLLTHGQSIWVDTAPVVPATRATAPPQKATEGVSHDQQYRQQLELL